MIGLNSVTTVNLVATRDSAPFDPKYVMIRSHAAPLGRQLGNRASPTNGIFNLGGNTAADDVPVSPAHAELYVDNGQVFVRDSGSKYGTWVDGQRVQRPTLLKDGSILALGVPIQRSAETPASVTDDFLKPIVAEVTIVQ
ncbi:hypothetical protein EWM64_g5345 [Hericium alpestre]|uniref:FHA domain-containing protein n=1 Tax=Hericium alpestre TaxID=135208 RepID=A0A4Y9ZWU8_9AGAM|nr:hypothetical protein EWM64_g5345 [Hericium alpestre]